MRNIEISPVPNQSFFIRVDNVRLNVAIREARGVMVFDLDIEQVPVLRGHRILAGEPIIPFAYLEIGNFVMITSNEELPTYEEFGRTQLLTYLEAAEIA